MGDIPPVGGTAHSSVDGLGELFYEIGISGQVEVDGFTSLGVTGASMCCTGFWIRTATWNSLLRHVNEICF